MEKVCYLFIIFIIYSFIGWLIEVANFLINEKRFINRGFLIGPYCPIYGVGIILMINFLKDYLKHPVALFVLAMFICMVLEYLTSYIMEKLFNARWWDYSNKKYNINGRICLETTIPFGLGGLLVMYLINPFIESILSNLKPQTIIIIGIILLAIFLIDLIISLIVILKIKNFDFSKYRDNTTEINKKIKEYFKKYSPLTKRLIDSFPTAIPKVIKKRIKNKSKKK